MKECFVGREEIKEIEESAEIGSQRERERHWSRPGQGPVDRPVDWWTEPGRPACTTCTDMARSTPRSTVAKERSTERSTDWYERALGWSRSTENKGRLTGRSTDRRVFFSFLDSVFFSVLGRIQSGFPKSLRLSGYKYGLEPSCIVSLEVSLWYSLVLIVESIKSLSLAPRT